MMEIENKCYCGKELKLINSVKGYRKFCSCKCKANSSFNKEKLKESNLLKYGLENVSQSNFIKDKKKETCLSKYGVNNSLEAFKEKIEEINLEKYGNTNPAKTSLIKDRISISNKLVSDKAKIIRKETMIERYGIENSYLLKKKQKESLFEIELRKKLNGKKIKIQNCEFDIFIEPNILIEVDGNYFHPDKIEELSFTQINNVLNDIKKEKIAEKNNYKLYRIRKDSLLINLSDVIKSCYTPDRNISFETVIISYKRCSNYIERNGIDKFKKNLELINRFFKEVFNILECNLFIFDRMLEKELDITYNNYLLCLQ